METAYISINIIRIIYIMTIKLYLIKIVTYDIKLIKYINLNLYIR